MDFFSGSGSRKFISFRLGKEMDGQPSQIPAEDMDVDVPNTERSQELEATRSPVDKQSVVELPSNTDTESISVHTLAAQSSYWQALGQLPHTLTKKLQLE